jgi:PST family polysaccharide transporter
LTEQTELTAALVAKGSIYLTLQNILSTLIAVFGFAFMARMITQEEMGVIAGLTLLTSLAALVSDFGLNSSVLKHVSELRGKGENISNIVVSATTFRTVVCLIIASTLFVIAPNLSESLFKTNAYAYTIRLLSIDAVLLSISPLFNSVLLGAGKLRAIAVYGTASIIVRWLLITAFLLAGKGLDGILLGWIAGDTILLFMLAATVTKLVEFKKQTFQSARQQIPPLLRFASPLYLSSFVAFLYGWYDKALILAYLPLSDLGIYNTAYTAFSVLVTIASALGSALLPYYGMAYGKSDHQAITLGMKRASKYTMLAIFPLALGLLATSKPTLSLFAGPQYETGWTVLAVLSLFGLVYGIAPALSNLLLIYGKTKTILLLSFIPVVSSLALLPLIWISGLFGLAIMRGASIAFSFTLTAYFINKIVKIQIDKKTLTKTLTASTIMAATILILQQMSPDSHLLPLYILVGAATYIALIRALKVLNGEDIQLLRQVIGKRAAEYAARILGGQSEHT